MRRLRARTDAILSLVTTVSALLLAGCGPQITHGPPPSPELATDEFSVVTYNLYRFGYYDRDDDGQEDDFKPEDEVDAIVEILTELRPDVLAVQELGGEAALSNLITALDEAGLDYPHTAYLEGYAPYVKNGLLSRYPFDNVTRWTNLLFTVADTEIGVSRGFLEATIRVRDDYAFTLYNTHLKSKRYHELGQTEIRRSEARLLAQLVQERLEADPEANLVVAGDLNDIFDSAPVRLLTDDAGLIDLEPTDYVGDVWTHDWSWKDTYTRIDYLLCSPGMLPELVREKTRVVRHPLGRTASDHRPVVAVFKATETPAP